MYPISIKLTVLFGLSILSVNSLLSLQSYCESDNDCSDD